MIEPRVYRAAFLPAVLIAVIAAFSLQPLPEPLESDLAADVLFQGDPAAAVAREIVEEAPDRRPGTQGDAATADVVAAGFERAGFETEVDRFTASGRALTNVIGRRSGASRDQVVLVAPRDAASVPDLAGSATDTATLLELARALEGRASRKSLVLVSTDGSTLGNAGARRFAETAPDRGRIAAVLALSDLGAPGGAPRLVAWSNDDARVGLGLERTATEALRGEIEDAAGTEGLVSQLAHLALPLGIGAQGVLLESGIDAVRFSGTGELPPSNGGGEVDSERLAALGRAMLQTVAAIDSGPPLERGPDTYLIVAGNIVPEWAVSLLTLALILPALIASVDALARARRRREPVGRWMVWVAAGIAPFALGLGVAFLLVVTGRAPDAPPAALAPAAEPFGGADAAVLGVVAAVVALGWIFGRSALIRRSGARGDPAAPGAACATAVILSFTVLLVWALNPFAAAALLPAIHLWLLATFGDFRGPAVRVSLVLAGLVLPATIALFYLDRLGLGPLGGAWYLFLTVTGGQVGILQALAGCVLAGLLASVIAIVVARGRRRDREAERRPAVRGPGGYAGPGSLGGTESALPRR